MVPGQDAERVRGRKTFLCGCGPLPDRYRYFRRRTAGPGPRPFSALRFINPGVPAGGCRKPGRQALGLARRYLGALRWRLPCGPRREQGRRDFGAEDADRHGPGIADLDLDDLRAVGVPELVELGSKRLRRLRFGSAALHRAARHHGSQDDDGGCCGPPSTRPRDAVHASSLKPRPGSGAGRRAAGG
ncbi:hypothetical protein D9M72_486540 [compost metagenome]